MQRTDPYMNYLLEFFLSSGPTSLRRGQDNRTTIHAGDVVVYEESNAEKAFKSWEARFQGPISLEAQLGVGWGNFQTAEGIFAQVIPESEVLLCYTHSHPDRLRMTVRVTRGQEGGGSVQLLPGDHDQPPAEG